MKLSVCALSVAMLLSSCGGMTNTAKGGLIGGTSGGALGALVGQLIGKGKGAAIGAAVGTAVGAGAGVLIGNKMDKAKKAAEAANAKAEILQGTDGTQYVRPHSIVVCSSTQALLLLALMPSLQSILSLSNSRLLIAIAHSN